MKRIVWPGATTTENVVKELEGVGFTVTWPKSESEGAAKERKTARWPMDFCESTLYQALMDCGVLGSADVTVRAGEWIIRQMGEINGRRYALGLPAMTFEPIHPMDLLSPNYWQVETDKYVWESNP